MQAGQKQVGKGSSLDHCLAATYLMLATAIAGGREKGTGAR